VTLRDSVDGLLLIHAWPHLNLPDVVREAWQPVIDAATASQDKPPRDPGGFSARIAGEIPACQGELRPAVHSKPAHAG